MKNVEAAAKWDCRGKFCGDGGCLRAAGPMKLLLCRQEFEKQIHTAKNADARRQGLHNLLVTAQNLKDKTKSRINVAYTDGSDRSSIELCDKGVGLGVCSVSSSYFGQIRAGVAKGDTLVEVSGCVEGGGKGAGDLDHREGLLEGWLRAYYGRHAEHDPVPGAKRTEQFSAPSEAADVTYDLYKKSFGDQALKKTRFKALLKVFKKAFVHDSGKSNHGHCDECQRLKEGIKMYRAVPDARREWEDDLKDHKLTVDIERQEMDDAGARSILSPWEVLTIQVDAATQANFMLPRVKGTKTKGAAAWTRLKQKIFGTFAFGAGSRIWLVPPCIKAGADLTITIVHLAVLAALVDRGGVLPQELHLQLDNTSGDNKNEAMVLYAAWLVETGQVLRVRLFFLPKGHTHILIDQLFGRITVGCRGKTIPSVADLLRIISEQMARKSARKYSFKSAESLQHTWSWTEFLRSARRHTIGGMNTAEFNYGGYHDLLITADSEGSARFSCRQSSQSTFYEPQDQPQGALIWKDGPPRGLPGVAPFFLPTEWGRDAIMASVRAVEDLLKTTLSLSQLQTMRHNWENTFAAMPSSSADLRADQVSSCTLWTAIAAPDQRAARHLDIERVNAQGSEIENPVICTLTCSGRTKAQVDADIRSFKAGLIANSSGDLDRFPVFPGSFVLARATTAAQVQLVQVVKLLQRGMYTSRSLSFSVTVFSHNPQRNVPGLYGTFQPQEGTAAGGKRSKRARKFETMTISRDNVVLYHVFPDPVKTGKGHFKLALNTLKRLHEQDSIQPYHQPPPLTHRPQSGSRGRRARSGDSSEDEDDQDDEEEGEEDEGGWS